MDQSTPSIKTIPGIPKECDRKICTCLMVHNRRPQLSTKTRCSFRKSNNWHTFTHLFLSQLSTPKGKGGQRSGENGRVHPSSDVLLTAEKESLFSSKTSIKIDLHNKDDLFIFLFQLKYYLVTAKVSIFELAIFFLLNCKEVT